MYLPGEDEHRVTATQANDSLRNHQDNSGTSADLQKDIAYRVIDEYRIQGLPGAVI